LQTYGLQLDWCFDFLPNLYPYGIGKTNNYDILRTIKKNAGYLFSFLPDTKKMRYKFSAIPASLKTLQTPNYQNVNTRKKTRLQFFHKKKSQ